MLSLHAEKKPQLIMIKYLQIFALAALFNFSNPLFSQTGPGGVGQTNGNSDLVLWLNANTINQTNNSRVASWSDNSGYNNNASSPDSPRNRRPVFSTGAINGYSKVRFNQNNGERLSIDDDESLRPNTISVFVVGNLTSKTDKWGGFVSKISSTWNNSWNNGYALARNNGSESITAYVSDWDDRKLTTSTTYGVNQIMTLNYNKSEITLYKNEFKATNRTFTSNINNSNAKLWLGWAEGVWSGHYLDGDIAETIILNRHVNEAERIIIHNYLSAKYNIPLAVATNNYYKQDDFNNGDFDHHVAGIGKTTGANIHSDSQGTGIVRINNPSSLPDNSFLFWGEDTKNSTYHFTTNNSNYSEQLNSKWRVSKTGTISTVAVSFDVTQMNIPNAIGCKGLQLVIANNSNFTSPRVYSLTVAGNNAAAS